jgi:DNA-binding transcriptional LysR family regulator
LGVALGVALLVPAAAAQPSVRVRAATQLVLRTSQSPRGLDIEGSLTDDLGFVGNVPVNPNLAVTPLWKEELVVIAKTSHSFGKTPTIRPSDLSHQPLIVREKGSGTREYIEGRLRRHGVAIKTVMEIGSDEAIKRAVAVGLGISIVPVGVVAKEVKRGLIKPYRMDGETLYLEYFMIWHKDKYLSNLIRAFMDATVGHFKLLMTDPKPPPGPTAAGRRRKA